MPAYVHLLNSLREIVRTISPEDLARHLRVNENKIRIKDLIPSEDMDISTSGSSTTRLLRSAHQEVEVTIAGDGQQDRSVFSNVSIARCDQDLFAEVLGKQAGPKFLQAVELARAHPSMAHATPRRMRDKPQRFVREEGVERMVYYLGVGSKRQQWSVVRGEQTKPVTIHQDGSVEIKVPENAFGNVRLEFEGRPVIRFQTAQRVEALEIPVEYVSEKKSGTGQTMLRLTFTEDQWNEFERMNPEHARQLDLIVRQAQAGQRAL